MDLTQRGRFDGDESSPPRRVRGFGGSAPVLDASKAPILNRKPTNRPETVESLRKRVLRVLLAFGATKEANAIASCGMKSVAFDCEGRHVIEVGAVSHVRHRVEKRILCGRHYCPRCGEVGSETHRRRAARLSSAIFGIHFAKEVVTLPAPFRAALHALPVDEHRKKLASMMKILARVVAEHYVSPAAVVALHWLGEVSQEEHYEVIFPHDGTRIARADWDADRLALREEIAAALKCGALPVVHFQPIDNSLPASDQAGKWWHKLRYACHPSIGAEKLAGMDPQDAERIVKLSKGFRTIRGYGLWSDRKVKTSREALALLYPMPGEELASNREKDVELFDGAPCPAEGCASVLHHVGIVAASDDGDEIAPGVRLQTLRRFTELDRLELGRDLMTA